MPGHTAETGAGPFQDVPSVPLPGDLAHMLFGVVFVGGESELQCRQQVPRADSDELPPWIVRRRPPSLRDVVTHGCLMAQRGHRSGRAARVGRHAEPAEAAGTWRQLANEVDVGSPPVSKWAPGVPVGLCLPGRIENGRRGPKQGRLHPLLKTCPYFGITGRGILPGGLDAWQRIADNAGGGVAAMDASSPGHDHPLLAAGPPAFPPALGRPLYSPVCGVCPTGVYHRVSSRV
jgi:hypothetical protein